ncbi:hypothetical protein DRO58_03205 [Candidatus Bathyarchaeota archaeon]|nr:MAG: hypothetical protein DRO58_03205 [Candidatus Bathyarchaeota archaeon]
MGEITLKVDGREVKGREGDSILDICKANGIHVPTLCHIEGLSAYGACRLCLVEDVKTKKLIPACAISAANGMEILTNSERLRRYRRMIVELLLSERNHFCFFCEKSGDCELQSLAYEFGIDHVRFTSSFNPFPIDSTHDYIVIDNNRCILCGRCLRVCSEIVGNDTIDFVRRGWETTINDPKIIALKESNCISCGACVEVCPTGAIFDRLSAYMGRKEECDAYKTVCIECPMACDLTVYTKDNNIIRICGGSLTGRYGGQLCKRGRFDLLFDGNRERITRPLIQSVEGGVREISFSEAIEKIVSEIKGIKEKFGEDSVAGVISSRCTNEAALIFRELMSRVIGTRNIFVLEPELSLLTYDAIIKFHEGVHKRMWEARSEEILKADKLILVGFDSSEPHPIISSMVRRAVNQKGAKVVYIGSLKKKMPFNVDLQLNLKRGTEEAFFKGVSKIIYSRLLVDRERRSHKEIDLESRLVKKKVEWVTGVEKEKLERFLNYIKEGERGIVITGKDLDPNPSLLNSILVFSALLGRFSDGRLPLISLRSGGNSRGVLDILYPVGVRPLDRDLRDVGIRAAYVMLSDERFLEPAVSARMMNLDFLAVQASFNSNLTLLADVVLPSLTWAEKEGTITDIDGNLRRLNRVIQPPSGLRKDEEIMFELIKGLKTELRYEDLHKKVIELYSTYKEVS